jgi:DegV family protein with EDD domain
MSDKIAILTDGVCDLSKEMVKKYDIVTVPYRIFFGDEIYRIWHNEKSTISLEDFCSKLNGSSKEQLPRTSLPSPGEFKEAFEEALEKADQVIAVILTSGMSGSVQAAQNVVNTVFPKKDITIFDSQQTMSGTGIQALEAAKMAAEGKSKKEILNRLEAINPRIRTIFIMNDLDYLEKQGRLGPIKKMREKFPDLIAAIHMKDGILQPLTVFKNSEELMTKMTSLSEKVTEHIESRDLFLTHINHKETSQAMYNRFNNGNPNEIDIHYYEAGAILGVYSGPKTICLSYIGYFDKKWLS